MKPGLWVHTLSKMCALLRSCNARLEAAGDARRLPLPPVFDECTRVLDRDAERRARDDYWRAVTELRGPDTAAEAEAALVRAASDNPFVAEPRALLAQLALQRGDLEASRGHLEDALRLLCEWGTCWDKRMPWGCWVAWVRALLHRADQGLAWPERPFGVLNFGMVSGL